LVELVEFEELVGLVELVGWVEEVLRLGYLEAALAARRPHSQTTGNRRNHVRRQEKSFGQPEPPKK